MIVDPPFVDNLSRVKIDEDNYETMTNSIREDTFSEGDMFGFTSETITSESIEAYLIVRTPTKTTDFNPNTNQVEETTRDNYTNIPFRIDFHKEFLEVFSGKEDVQKVEMRLGQSSGWELSVSGSHLDLRHLSKYLKERYDNVNIKSMKIKNFSINEHTSGLYHPKVFDQTEVERLLEAYQDDVIYISIEFDFGPEEITVGVYHNGTVQFYSKTERYEDILESIKDSILMKERSVHA